MEDRTDKERTGEATAGEPGDRSEDREPHHEDPEVGDRADAPEKDRLDD